MAERKPPLLLRGGLTGRVYVVTAYTDHGDGRITAKTKHDVTEQYNALRAEDESPESDDGCDSVCANLGHTDDCGPRENAEGDSRG